MLFSSWNRETHFQYLVLNSPYKDVTMSSPASFSNIGDRLSGPEDLFDFSSLTFLHILWGEISIWFSIGGEVLPNISIIYDLWSNSGRNFFLYRPVNTEKPNFVSFLVFAGATASFTAKILSFETVAKREAILNPVAKQWISKDIPSYGSQSERAKIAINSFGEY